MLVVVYHAGLFGFELPWNLDRFGWIGVDLFFVLSGYLIGGQLLAMVARGQRPDVRRFYSRRALRILPAYLAVVAIYFFLPGLREFPSIPPAWKFLSFTQNLGLHGGTAFSHAWSLCIESQFYLLLPFIVLALAGSRHAALVALCAIVLFGILIRASLAHFITSSAQPAFGSWQPLIYYPTYARLDPLTMGVALAVMENFRPRWWLVLTKSAKWLWAPGIASIVLALLLSEDRLSLVTSAFGFPLIALGFSALLVCAVSPELSLSRVAIPGAAFLATVAYSTYLSHKLAIHWAENFSASHPLVRSPVSAYFLMLAAIGVVGCALFLAVERPFLQLRQRYLRLARAR